MKPVVAIIAPGAMGAAVGQRLSERGLEVRTLLAGRSPASAARAKAAGLKAVDEAGIVAADLILSILPPGDALGLAESLAPKLAAVDRKPVFVDCNAVSPNTAIAVAAAIAPSGAPFVDAGIIGGPPTPDGKGPTFYASGSPAAAFTALGEYGLKIRWLDGPVGAASALKMSYAGITKGLTALGAAMMLAATRAGMAAALHRELAESQPMLLAWLGRSVPGMYPKAYRWVAEMEEIAGFVGEDAAAEKIFEGAAGLYTRLAADVAGNRLETGALTAFLERKP